MGLSDFNFVYRLCSSLIDQAALLKVERSYFQRVKVHPAIR